MDWHRALEHPAAVNLYCYSDGQLISMPQAQYSCKSCIKAKSTHQLPPAHPATAIQSARPLASLYSDLSGRAPQESYGNSQYFLIIIDFRTRYSWIYFLKYKGEAPRLLKAHISQIERQFNTTILSFHTDYGTEYCNQDFDSYLQMKGIQHYKSPPYCHDTNGIPERYMRTLQTMMRALLDGQDQKLWAEAASAANYLKKSSST